MNKAPDNIPKVLVPNEVIASKIYLIRGQKVMLDRDLAQLYSVETKQLKRAVKRNIERFPVDFMFEFTKDEFENWRCQFGTSNSEKMGLRYPPFAFTEHGVLMLSSVLNSKRAVQMNIQIMRIYTRMREILLSNKDLLLKVERLEQKFGSHDRAINVIFEHLKKLIQHEEKPRKQIGFQIPQKKSTKKK
ncbi:MAG: ORF6N domain-containing protein [Cytophagales bacterium]|nr:ORF6N domain-containing protein [Cytophagales bacterium]